MGRGITGPIGNDRPETHAMLAYAAALLGFSMTLTVALNACAGTAAAPIIGIFVGLSCAGLALAVYLAAVASASLVFAGYTNLANANYRACMAGCGFYSL